MGVFAECTDNIPTDKVLFICAGGETEPTDSALLPLTYIPLKISIFAV